jgi:hypothetical protein
MSEEILKKLSEPFPKEVESILRKGGMELTYIPIHEVIARLSNVLGVENWNYTIKSHGRDTKTDDWVIVHVQLSVIIEGSVVVREAFGGARHTGNMDLGDSYKSATSEALKKAAQTLGVGLYLARDDIALELEEAPDPKVQNAWDNFLSLMTASDFTEEKKNALNEFWVKHSGGRPKPNINTMTDTFVADVMALSEEAVRLSFNAVAVADEEDDA